MVYQADLNGHGYISYDAFERIVENYKNFKEDTVSFDIGLTYDEILKAFNIANQMPNNLVITWNYIQEYLEEIF